MSTDDIDAMAAQCTTDVLVDPVAHFRHNGFSEAHAFEGVR